MHIDVTNRLTHNNVMYPSADPDMFTTLSRTPTEIDDAGPSEWSVPKKQIPGIHPRVI